MIMKNCITFALLVSSLPLFGQTNAPADGTNSITPFQQAVADCQQTWTFPNAEKVAKLTAGMETLPPIPEEARKHFVMGGTVFKEAANKADFLQAAMEFYQACTNAPWFAKAWNNMAVSCEKADNYDYALNSLKVYLDFKLSDDEARAAQDMVYKIQAEKDLAAKHAADDAANAQSAVKVQDGTHFSPQDQSSTGDYKYITAKNIKSWGLDLTNVTYVSEKVHRPIYERCNPEKGDVLYIKDGATTGIATVSVPVSSNTRKSKLSD